MLGSLEAISAGKPMIIIPVFADQILNAASIKETGFAEVLSLANLNQQDLERALKNVLSERSVSNIIQVNRFFTFRFVR